MSQDLKLNTDLSGWQLKEYYAVLSSENRITPNAQYAFFSNKDIAILDCMNTHDVGGIEGFLTNGNSIYLKKIMVLVKSQSTTGYNVNSLIKIELCDQKKALQTLLKSDDKEIVRKAKEIQIS